MDISRLCTVTSVSAATGVSGAAVYRGVGVLYAQNEAIRLRPFGGSRSLLRWSAASHRRRSGLTFSLLRAGGHVFRWTAADRYGYDDTAEYCC